MSAANGATSDGQSELQEAIRIGRKHGRERAARLDYSIDQLVFEYHILRQVICEVLEEEAPLKAAERELITCSIEQAVSDAATEFSDTLRAVQERFFNAMAHDLRSPLMTVRMGARLILQRPDDARQHIEAARRITTSTVELESMIDGLLSTGQIKAGQQEPLKLRQCALDIIVRQVADEFNFTYGNRLRIDEAREVVGYWDQDALRRVLENLATNAIKHGERGTPVTLTLRKSGELVALSIHDCGPPIPPERLSALFQPSGSGQPTKSGAGWGLGLIIVKRIIEAHGGRLHVSSAERVGTTFLAELPLGPRR